MSKIETIILGCGVFEKRMAKMQMLVGTEYTPGTFQKFKEVYGHLQTLLKTNYGLQDMPIKQLSCSMDDFKRTQQVDKIEIKRNDATGKFFFVYGFESGPCSGRVAIGGLTEPVVSQVCSADTGDMCMMLHQRGEGGAQTVATL